MPSLLPCVGRDKTKVFSKESVPQLTGVQIHNVPNKRVFAIRRGYTLQSKSTCTQSKIKICQWRHEGVPEGSGGVEGKALKQ